MYGPASKKTPVADWKGRGSNRPRKTGVVLRAAVPLAVMLGALVGALALHLDPLRAQPSDAVANGAWSVGWVKGFDGPIPHEAGLSFNTDGKVVGSGGCNRLNGRFTRDNGAIVLADGLGRTRRMCPPDIMGFENAFVAALETSGLAGRVDGDDLIFAANGAPVIKLKKIGSLN